MTGSAGRGESEGADGEVGGHEAAGVALEDGVEGAGEAADAGERADAGGDREDDEEEAAGGGAGFAPGDFGGGAVGVRLAGRHPNNAPMARPPTSGPAMPMAA